MAERMGFEPMKEFPLYTLSKRAPSTARPPLLSQIINSLNLILLSKIYFGNFLFNSTTSYL